MRVLIAEDETELAEGLKYLLERNRFTVDIVHNGEDALQFIHRYSYHVIVLDIMMPRINGLEVLLQLRRERSAVPVMMLTAKSGIEDRCIGLDSGADDYLPKPFATREFISRVKALARRASEQYESETLQFSQTRLDCVRYELVGPGGTLRLNNKEFQLLELFFRSPRRVWSAAQLIDSVWQTESDAGTDVLWTHIGYIRKKLKLVDADVEIRTIRGAGYALEKIEC